MQFVKCAASDNSGSNDGKGVAATACPFEKLTPINNCNLEAYKDALDFAFTNDDLLNIAITGPYGSGKSSVIETYLANPRSKIKHLRVTLAQFDGSFAVDRPVDDEERLDDEGKQDAAGLKKQGDGTNPHSHFISPIFPSAQEATNILEGKIINQIIHQIDPKHIPLTLFRTKAPVNKARICCISIVSVLFVAIALYFVNYGNLAIFFHSHSDYMICRCLRFVMQPWFSILLAVGAAAILGGFIYHVIKLQIEKRVLKRLNVKGNEVDLFPDKDESCFDKYLEEIIYLIQESSAKAIVFEDMDRFQDNTIFEKLRELCYLVNAKQTRLNGNVEKKWRRIIRRKRDTSRNVIRFLYLVRDDLFSTKDRVKFFDYIIPVVPIVVGSNSYEEMRKLFTPEIPETEASRRFFRNVSLYIDDMRLIRNIYNEYCIYSKKINVINLNELKLLALIIYKNLFPSDYSKLQHGEGNIVDILSQRNEIQDLERESLQNKIDKLTKHLNDMKNESARDLDELEALYLPLPNGRFVVDNETIEEDLPRPELIRRIKRATDSVICQNSINGRNSTQEIDYESLKAILNDNHEYQARKSRVENRLAGKTLEYEQEINQLEAEIPKLPGKTLCELLSALSESETNKFWKRPENDPEKFALFLIRNGYIDETYSDYLSYYYEYSLRREDKIFLRSLSDRTALSYAYRLASPEQLVKELDIQDFNRPEVLNFNLLTYLLAENHSFLPYMLSRIREERRMDFVMQYFEAHPESAAFIQSINQSWPTILDAMLTNDSILESQKHSYIVASLRSCSEATLTGLNGNGALAQWINGRSDFFSFAPAFDRIVYEHMSALGVRFTSIDYDKNDRHMLQEAYAFNLYELNAEIIALILDKAYGLSEQEYRSKNYTMICSDPAQPLYAYAQSHLQTYVETIVGAVDIIKDDEACALKILNATTVTLSTKQAYLHKLSTSISCIEDVTEQALWDLLFVEKHLIVSQHNILKYYVDHAHAINPILVDYLNDAGQGSDYNMAKIRTELGDEQTGKFYWNIIHCNTLRNEIYEKLISIYDRYYTHIDDTKIASDKMAILIKWDIIAVTAKNLSVIRGNYPELTIPFVKRDVRAYIAELKKDTALYQIEEVLDILEARINGKQGESLLRMHGEPISIRNRNFADSIIIHILDHNFDINDAALICNRYDRWPEKVQKAAIRAMVHHQDEIFPLGRAISYPMLTAFINAKLAAEQKCQLFADSIQKITLPEARGCLPRLNKADIDRVFEGYNPVVLASVENEQILKNMRARGWIGKYTKEGNRYRVYGKRKLIS